MRMLRVRDSPTVAVVDTWPPAQAPAPLHVPWSGSFGMTDDDLPKAGGGSTRDMDSASGLHPSCPTCPDKIAAEAAVLALCLVAFILIFQILGCLTEGCCDCCCDDDAAAAAPPPPPTPPHAAAAAAVAAAASVGPAPATDAWLKKWGLREIPVAVYEAKPGASPATDDCVICLGEFGDGDKVCVLPRCHHVFHVPCIDPWLSMHPSCPTCRDLLRI